MSTPTDRPPLPGDFVAFVKRDCPTCLLVEPVLAELAAARVLTVFSQDDPDFPSGPDTRDDTSLEQSWQHEIEAVPTLLRTDGAGREEARAIGWHRGEWEALTGMTGLGADLPDQRMACGSLSVSPDLAPELAFRFGHRGPELASRVIELGAREDAIETLFERGWSDGLPMVPPTERRVRAMLEGTSRAADEIVASVPPDLAPCSVEKVAINAVMAGCRPEYLPVVLAAVEAACTDEFNIHGLLATTMPVAPVIVVNGPIRKILGMNSGINALGQGNRANSTIGRALQLVIRNVGGGRPGGIDRATHGSPAKLSFCFAELEEGSPFTPLAQERGVPEGRSAVTLFPGEAPRNVIDQLSRDPESLAASLAVCLRTIHHPKLVLGFDVLLVIGPEHGRVFAEAGWSRGDLIERLHALLQIPGGELVRGAGGIAEGMPETIAQLTLPKFRPDGILVVHSGGGAGLFSTIIGGWLTGAEGSRPVTREIGT
jgi:hypothetical protein